MAVPRRGQFDDERRGGRVEDALEPLHIIGKHAALAELEADLLDEPGQGGRCVHAANPVGLKGLPRLWDRSGVFRGAHIQLSVREPNNILAVWPVRKDGRYGKDQ